MPEFNGIKLSLSSILLSNYYLTYDKETIDKIRFLVDFNKLIKKCNFKKTEPKNAENLLKLIKEVKKHDNTLYIVTPCCPDYSKERAGKSYSFTFNSIEDQIVKDYLNILINFNNSFSRFNKVFFYSNSLENILNFKSLFVKCRILKRVY